MHKWYMSGWFWKMREYFNFQQNMRIFFDRNLTIQNNNKLLESSSPYAFTIGVNEPCNIHIVSTLSTHHIRLILLYAQEIHRLKKHFEAYLLTKNYD